ERKAARVIPARARFRYAREEFTYGREPARIGGRIAAWRAPAGTLLDGDDLVEMLHAFQAVVAPRCGLCPVQGARNRRGQRVIDQGGLARARYAGDAYKVARRNGQVD